MVCCTVDKMSNCNRSKITGFFIHNTKHIQKVLFCKRCYELVLQTLKTRTDLWWKNSLATLTGFTDSRRTDLAQTNLALNIKVLCCHSCYSCDIFQILFRSSKCVTIIMIKHNLYYFITLLKRWTYIGYLFRVFSIK